MAAITGVASHELETMKFHAEAGFWKIDVNFVLVAVGCAVEAVAVGVVTFCARAYGVYKRQARRSRRMDGDMARVRKLAQARSALLCALDVCVGRWCPI